jgi:hypothetical protein
MGPQMVRSQYSHLFGTTALPALEEMFWSTYNQHPSRRDELFKQVSSSMDIYQASEMHDLDLFQEIPEGTSHVFKRPKQGASKTLTNLKYGMGASISEEAVEDGKFDQVADLMRKLGRSAKESKEISGMNVFNNGFSTETANDGLAVFHTAHTLPSGLTFRNRLSSDADLSNTSLDQAVTDFETQNIGDTGIIERIEPKILLVHSSMRRYATELLNSSLKADTSDNNMNSFQQEGLRVVSSPHLTDADAWFLLAAPEDTGLRVVNRKSLAIKSEEQFRNDSLLIKASYREIVGVIGAKGVFGTTGA